MFKTTRPLFIALTVALLVPLVAWGGRVSLAGIDAKLDRLLAGPFTPASHVTLELRGLSTTVCPSGSGYVRLRLDGTRDTVEFDVPRNHTLFITDLSMTVADPSLDFIPGRMLTTDLRARNADGTEVRTVYLSSAVEITTNNENAVLYTRDVSVAGVAIGEGRYICANASTRSLMTLASHDVTNSILHGVLVAN